MGCDPDAAVWVGVRENMKEKIMIEQVAVRPRFSVRAAAGKERMTPKKKTLDPLRYPLRLCRTMRHCESCKGTIRDGEFYRDGGYGRRVHLKCIAKAMMERAEGGG